MRATQLRSNSHARYDEGSASVSSSSPHDTHNFATSIKSDAQLASFISRKSNILHCKIHHRDQHLASEGSVEQSRDLTDRNRI